MDDGFGVRKMCFATKFHKYPMITNKVKISITNLDGNNQEWKYNFNLKEANIHIKHEIHNLNMKYNINFNFRMAIGFSDHPLGPSLTISSWF